MFKKSQNFYYEQPFYIEAQFQNISTIRIFFILFYLKCVVDRTPKRTCRCLPCRSVWSVNLFYGGTIIEFLLLIADSHVDHADDSQLDTRILVQTSVYFDKNKVITNNLLPAHNTA